MSNMQWLRVWLRPRRDLFILFLAVVALPAAWRFVSRVIDEVRRLPGPRAV